MKKILLLLLIAATHTGFSQVTTIVKSSLRIETPMFEVNGNLLFAGDTGTSKVNLWSSDGTNAGTHVVKTFAAGMYPQEGVGFSVYDPVVFNGELYFIADSTSGYEAALWKSDGTTQGTVLVKSFNGQMMGPYYDSYPFFTILNNELFFAAGDGVHGVELWKTDGTTQGTTMVKDIAADNNLGSQPSHLISYKNELYFSCYNETYGVEIWKSDGTDVGTTILKDVIPGTEGVTNDGYGGSIDPEFTVSGNYLYFTGHNHLYNDGPYLYRTDGSSSGTIILDSTNFVLDPLAPGRPFEADLNGELLYMAYPASGTNSSLYKSDGTPAGTVNVTTNNSLTAYATFFIYNGKLYFHGAQNSGADDGLCVSDGTTSGTSLVKGFPYVASSPDIRDFISAGNSFFFRAEMSVNSGQTDWRICQSNGITQGTVIYFNGVSCSGFITSYKNDIYFYGLDSATSNIFSLYKLTPSVGLGVNGIQSPNNIASVYPNPTSNNLNIILGQNQAHCMMSITDVTGRIMLQKTFNGKNNNIDLSSLVSGIYIMQLCTDTNSQTVKIFKN